MILNKEADRNFSQAPIGMILTLNFITLCKRHSFISEQINTQSLEYASFCEIRQVFIQSKQLFIAHHVFNYVSKSCT